MLALTGVDIQIDDKTYKSTYQVLLEMSKVWKDLNDMTKASILETMFGKRQVNIGAAILENGELLEQVYKTAEESQGSALREQEEYAKSIQYTLDTLSATWQEFAQTVMSSDFLKGIIGSAQTLLELVTKVIDKVGVLPTLLASFGAIGSFKNFGVFRTIADDATVSGQAITVFGKKLKDVIADYKSVTDDKIGGQKIKAAFSGMFSINSSELASLRQYATEIKNISVNADFAKESSEIFNRTVATGSSALQNRAKQITELNAQYRTGAISEQAYSAAMAKLTTNTTLATIATNGLKLALNTLVSIGIGLAINAIVSGITKLANAEEEARQKAEEARQAAVDRANSYQQEADSIDGLRDQYVKLATTTTNLIGEKEKLSSIQDDINKGISDQKERVDLLNGSLSENLENIRQLRVEEAKDVIRDTQLDYEKASQEMSLGVRMKSLDFNEPDIIKKFQAILGTKYVSSASKDGITLGVNFETGEVLGFEVALQQLDKLIDGYSALEDRDDNVLQTLIDTRKQYGDIYDVQSQIVETYETAQRIIEENTALNAEDSKQYKELIDNAQQAILKFQELKESGATASQLQESQSYLIGLRNQLMNLVGSNVELRNEIVSVFGAIDIGTGQAETEIQSLQSEIDSLSTRFSELQKVFDKDVKGIEKIQTAMQEMAEGKTISRKDAWEIFEIDTEGILSDIRLVNGEYKFSTEQLQTLMDKTVEKRKESILAIKEEAEAEVASAKVALSVAKTRLRVNSASDVQYVKQYQEQIKQAEEALASAESTLRNTNRMLADIETFSGDVVDYSKVLDAKTKEIDKTLKSQKAEIDAQIKSIELVVKGLEAEKDALEEQKETLNEQKEELEEIVNQYKNAESAVKKLTDAEKESLTEERDERKEYWSKQIEDSKEYYNAQIDALKAEHDAKKEVESLEKKKLDIQEKQLEVQKKQKELEDARAKRVRTYSASRGWTYMGDQDAIATAQENFDKAQQALIDAQKLYQDEIEENSYNAKIKNLEKLRDEQNKLYQEQRDREIESFDEQIKAVEKYAKAWSNAVESVTTADQELVAEQILGSNWREKISKKDIGIIDNFKVNFERYNSQLKNITDIEIKNLEKSIKAKDKEIKARKAEIDAWNAQKTEIENAANAMKQTLEEYYNNLANANERIVNSANNTSSQFGSAMDEMGVSAWNTKEYVSSFTGEMADNVEENGNKMIRTAKSVVEAFEKVSAIMEMKEKANLIGKTAASGFGTIFDKLIGGRFAEGGVNTKTGVAWLDGTSSRPELVLNNADATKLYNFIHNSNFANYTPTPKTQPVTTGTKYDGATFVFNGVQNPQQFEQQMELWIARETTRSRVNGVGN